MLMISMHKKNVLGLFLIILSIFAFASINVYAAEKDKDEKDLELSEMCIKWKEEKISLLKDSYGINVRYIPENSANCAALENCDPNPKKFVLSMTRKSNPDNGDYVFKLDSIKIVKTDDQLNDAGILHTYSGAELTNVFGLSGNLNLSLTKELYIPNIADSQTRFRFVLVPVNFKNEDFIRNCGPNGKMEINVNFDYSGEPIYTEEHPDTQLLKPTAGQTGKIDCSVTYNPTTQSFNYNFCKDKAAAAAYGAAHGESFPLQFTTANNTYAKLAAAKNFKSAVIKYQCDPFGPLDKTKDSTDYYVNKDYLWGTIDYIVEAGPYIYNYGGQDEDGNGKNPKKENVSCTVKCEEVVSTEYGAPIASKAGLCIEYKVKVTSRVNCYVVKPPELPKTDRGYCTPAPGCDHGNGYVDPGAGPEQDFEACIERCDGGKYTDKCSKKCYNEVYGSTKTGKTSLEIGYDNRVTPTLLSNTVPRVEGNTCQDPLYGRYYYYPNRGIIWNPENMLGRWYCPRLNEFRYPCVKSDAEGGGIASVCGCSARCMWVGCGGNTYLNPGESKRDDEKNIKIYNDILKQCEAYTKCSTTQAEFSFDVSYEYEGGKEAKTIYYPYTSNNDSHAKDTIKYTRETASVACTSGNANTTILLSNGCYTCANGNSTNETEFVSNHWYQTEWSFPGTWLHIKTGEISYEPVNKPGWRQRKRKYCIPLNAKDVNEKWWNSYYINRYFNQQNLSYFVPSYSKCEVTSCDSKFTEADKKTIDYNINAHTRKFGLLEWDIDISCFYALNSHFPKHDGGSSCTVKDVKCLEEINAKKIRSVELTNLFPAEDGSTLSTPNAMGRTPGFNWSAYATNILKDQDFTSRPENYAKWVQKKGYNVYSDEYLDYEFDLTKDVIRRIKKQGDNFTEFAGDAIVNSVVNYRSNLFRGDNAIVHSDKIPSVTALKCNNIKNYRSDECDDFAEDGE